MNLSNYTDDELRRIAGIETSVSSMSDDELLRIANQPEEMPGTAAGVHDRSLAWKQGTAPSPFSIDNLFSLFRDPSAERAKAVMAIVDSEALGIRPDVALEYKSVIDKYYDINPERKKKKEESLDNIRRFNDMGGSSEEWMSSLWKNAKQVPYELQVAAGGILRFIEENPGYDPMFGISAIAQNKEACKLAAEAAEKKAVRTLGEDIAASGTKSAQELQPHVMPGSFQDTVGMSLKSMLNNLIWIAPGLFTGGGVTLGGMGLQAFGQSYQEQREAGMNTGTATLASVGKGASEVLTEFIPVGIYLKPSASFVRKLIAAEGSEIPTEVVNSMANDVINKVTIRPDMTAEDAIEDIATTIQVTALSTLGLAGTTYSVHKALGNFVQRTDLKDTFNQAKNQELADGKSAADAVKAGIEAVKGTPEGAALIEQKLSEIKKEAQSYKPEKSDQPFIFGVNEDANGDVVSFTMADPKTGKTFEVPAIRTEDKDKMTVKPDVQAVNAKLKEISAIDQEDVALDKLIQSDEDIDTSINKMFSDDVDDGQAPIDKVGEGMLIYNHENIQEEQTRFDFGQTESGQNETRDVSGRQGNNIPGPAVGVEVVGKYNAEKAKIESGVDLARLADANISKFPQENLISVVTDKNNKILRIYRHSVGSQNYSVLVSSVIVGNALNTPGAARLWLAHNHPTGDPALSAEDVKAGEQVINLLNGTGVSFGDIIAVGFDSFSGYHEGANINIGRYDADKSIPLSERVFINRVNSENKVTNAEEFKDYARKKGVNGIVLLDNKNRPVSIIESDDLTKIRGAIQEQILKEVDRTNASSMGVVFMGRQLRDEEISNIKAFSGAANLRLLDIIDDTGSAQERGIPLTGRDIYFYSGLDITQTLDVLRGLKTNIKEAMPHLEAIGTQVYQSGKVKYNEWSASMKETLGDLWESFKDSMAKLWESIKSINEQLGERGSFSTKKLDDVDEINMMLSAAARQDKAQGTEFIVQERFESIQQEASQQALDTILKKEGFAKRKINAADRRMGENEARQLPVFQAMTIIIKDGGISRRSLEIDYDKHTVTELSRKRPGLVSSKSRVGIDDYADQFNFESGDDLLNAILDWRGIQKEGAILADDFKDYFGDKISKEQASSFYEDYLKEYDKNLTTLTKKYTPKPTLGLKKVIREQTGQTNAGDRIIREYDALTAAFKKAAESARIAFREGKKGEIDKAKEQMRWLMRRRESLRNVRDYFNLTDADFLKATNRRNPALMEDAEFKQFLKDVELKAVELAENTHAKMSLIKLIEDKRLQKVDNYRQALQLPTIENMTTQQLKDFAALLEPFEDDDIFLTQRELETVDRTDLKGIRTWREAKDRLAKELNVDVEELNKVHVAALDQFRWDSALRERDPFFDMLVTKMTESMIGAELRAHNIESQVFELAGKSDKSQDRGVVERMIPQDELIMGYLEAPVEQKAAISEQMTPEQINYAHFIQQYFAEALNYLIATKAVERGRENYFVHIRKSFMENLKDGGLKKAFTEMFSTYQQDQIGFGILDDDTGNILPLEKFFQFSMHRTDVLDPTRNITKAFMTYVRTFERKKMFDAIIPKMDIYAQALTPARYTPRGLEIDRSLKQFVNKYINNKKGRKLDFGSIIKQGGPVDVGIRALRTFTTMLDLGFAPVTQIASFFGEQAATTAMIGPEGMAKGSSRLATEKGKRIIKKYEVFVGRSFWENFTAPGKEVSERLTEAMFGLFHISSVVANKQFLLSQLTEAEWNSETISNERLAKMRLDMGRFRAIPGTSSLVGSTSLGDAVTQYKGWAVPIMRSLMVDIGRFGKDLKNKPIGEALTTREAKELYRTVGLTMAVLVVGSMAGVDDEDKSYIGKAKSRMYREAMALMQGIDSRLWTARPRIMIWLAKTGEALSNIIKLEEYKTKEGLKGVGQLKQQVIPGAIRGLGEE